MKIFDYLDTSEEDSYRIREARENINKASLLTGILASICLAVGMLYIEFLFVAIIFYILCTGLVIKREIYSIVLFLRRYKE